MIAKLSGIIDSTSEDSLIIDVGEGYHVFCSGRTLNAVSTTVGMVGLYVETHVQEDHIHLFGFGSVRAGLV